MGTGASSRLVLRGADGAENSVRITATDDDGNNTDAAGLSALSFDPAATAGTGRNLSQTQAAQDAKYTLDGLALTSPTNTLSSVVEGVTLTLKKETASPVDVNVSVETVAVQPGAPANGPLMSVSTPSRSTSPGGVLVDSATAIPGASARSARTRLRKRRRIAI